MEISGAKPNKARDIALIFFIVLGVLLFRRTDAFTTPQLWAEDCPIFFQQAEEMGWRSLIQPYAGYLHMLPRIIAFLCSSLHLSYFYIPAAYNYSTFLFTFLIAVHIWYTATYLPVKHRIAYATSFLFLPLASDTFMNITNLNWIVSLYLVNFLFVRHTDHKPGYNVLTLIAIFIVSLTGPFSAVFSPLVLIILFVERKEMTIKKALPLFLILVGGLIQVICIKFIDTNFARGAAGDPEPFHFLMMFTNNVSQLFFFDTAFMQRWLSPFKMIVIAAFVFVIFLYNFFGAYFKIDNKRKYILLACGVLVLAAFIKAYWPNESKVLALNNSRYHFIPYTCIMWLLLLAFDKKLNSIIIGGYVLVFFFYFGQRDSVKSRLPDKHWHQQIQEYYDGKREVIDINPDGWQFHMPKKQ